MPAYDAHSGVDSSVSAHLSSRALSESYTISTKSPLTKGLLDDMDDLEDTIGLNEASAGTGAGTAADTRVLLGDVDVESASMEVRAMNRVHNNQLHVRSDTVTEALYWENRFLQTRIRRLQAAEFWSLPLHWKILTVLEFPVDLIRDASIPTLQLESWYRPYAVSHPIAIGLVCEWTFRDWHMRTVLKTLFVGAIPALAIHLNTHSSKPPTNPLIVMLWVMAAFFMCIVWMYLLCGELLCCLEVIGRILNIPSAYLGLTVLAWGNCIGDFFSISAIARRGLGEMAIAGCYGSPVFDILFGMGLSIISSTGKIYPEPFYIALDSSSFVSIGFLYFTLFTTLFVIGYRGWRIEKGFGYLLYTIYAVYTLVQVLMVVN